MNKIMYVHIYIYRQNAKENGNYYLKGTRVFYTGISLIPY